MNALDMFFLILILVGVLMGGLSRILRMFLAIVSAYVTLVSCALTYKIVAQYMAFFGKGPGMEAFVFITLFLLILLIMVLLLKWAFPDTRFMKLKIFDRILGAVLGAGFGVILGVVVYAVVGLLASGGAGMGGFLRGSSMISIYRTTLTLFDYSVQFMFPSGIPAILVPR